MKLIIITLLFTFSCILIQRYEITDMTLSNAGLNNKPISECYFKELQNRIDNIKEERYNSKKVVNAINQYAKSDSEDIINQYLHDTKYSLYKAGFFTGTDNRFSKYSWSYHEIPDAELEIYKSQLTGIKEIDVNNKEVFESIDDFLDTEPNTENFAIAHFIKHAQDYLVQKGMLQSEQPNTAIAEKINDIKHNIDAETVQTLTKAQVNVDSSTSKVLDTNSKSATHEVPATHAVDASITDITITSAGTKNDLYTKLNKYMSMHRVGKHKIPIAILSTVLGIGTIGGAYYATGSTDALDTIGSDTDTEVLNDTNDTAQRHGVCIATITACTVLLALCTTAYWIRKKQQHDIAYTIVH